MKIFHLLVVAFLQGILPASAQDIDPPEQTQNTQKIVWLYPDVPPFNIDQGPNRGKGSIDLIEMFLTNALPEYQHLRDVASFVRTRNEIVAKDNICTAALLLYKDREAFIEYSIPYMVVLPVKLIIKKSDRYKVIPYLNQQGQVDIQDLLFSGLFKLGVSKGRRYGNKNLDEVIQNPVKPNSIYIRHGTDQLSGLLQMLTAVDRAIHGVLGYPDEAAYFSGQLDISMDSLELFPIKDDPEYNSVHIGCSKKSALGKAIIAKLNPIIEANRRTLFLDFATMWLSDDFAQAQRRLTLKAFAAQ